MEDTGSFSDRSEWDTGGVFVSKFGLRDEYGGGRGSGITETPEVSREASLHRGFGEERFVNPGVFPCILMSEGPREEVGYSVTFTAGGFHIEVPLFLLTYYRGGVGGSEGRIPIYSVVVESSRQGVVGVVGGFRYCREYQQFHEYSFLTFERKVTLSFTSTSEGSTSPFQGGTVPLYFFCQIYFGGFQGTDTCSDSVS